MVAIAFRLYKTNLAFVLLCTTEDDEKINGKLSSI